MDGSWGLGQLVESVGKDIIQFKISNPQPNPWYLATLSEDCRTFPNQSKISIRSDQIQLCRIKHSVTTSNDRLLCTFQLLEIPPPLKWRHLSHMLSGGRYDLWTATWPKPTVQVLLPTADQIMAVVGQLIDTAPQQHNWISAGLLSTHQNVYSTRDSA